MKTLQELAQIRQKMQAQLANRDAVTDADTRIVVGMATCGIAAGARDVLNTLLAEVNKRGLKNVKVIQTGCIGLCKYEPIVEVYEPNKEKVTYVSINMEKAARIVSEHIVNQNVVTDFVLHVPKEDK